MKLCVYDPEKHFEEIQGWARSYRLNIRKEYCAPTGLVIEGVCASFLLLTNTGVAFNEPTFANPNISKAMRDEGLNKLGDAMWAYAKGLGVKTLQAYTAVPAIIARAQEHGWRVDDKRQFTVITKEL